MAEDSIKNATQGELEELNGLLVRELIAKIKEGTATGTDLSTAAKLMKEHKVQPIDPRVPATSYHHQIPEEQLDYPVDVNC
ncbi:hypothetical protein [Ruegeria arenilitoris]|uniref:hypothetical protein n=1 Tax=Ruegeria arenilitoris TaxID=1173585 RepID=UPI001479C259|nr:hypothetical protein [Ruegeria arenilitoris]